MQSVYCFSSASQSKLTYFSTIENTQTLATQNLSLHEISPWENLLCPKGFFISKILYSYDRIPIGVADAHQNGSTEVPVLPLNETNTKQLDMDLFTQLLKQHGSISKALTTLRNKFSSNRVAKVDELSYTKFWYAPVSFAAEEMKEREDFPYLFSSHAPDLFPPALAPSWRSFNQGQGFPLSSQHRTTPTSHPQQYPANHPQPPPPLPNEPEIDLARIAKHKTSLLHEQLGSCAPIIYCLGYQACQFRFSNEFCNFDPFPRIRKSLNVFLTCERDSSLSSTLNAESRQLRQEIVDKTSKVLYIKHESKMERLVRDYENVEISVQETDGEDAFGVICPSLADARNMGYRGNCSEEPMGVEEIHNKDKVWKMMSRTTPNCRNELSQVYCAYQYSYNGKCFPPFMMENSKDGDIKWTFNVRPIKGKRPNLNSYEKISSDPKQNLIPARLGIVIIGHQNAATLLLKSIYSPKNFYVVHVDATNSVARSQLERMIDRKYGLQRNVRVLPVNRSFTSSWASFYIFRAIMESLEELLRMGVWDSSLIISGSDLPLRHIDDLGLALAPYRGHSFMLWYDINTLAHQDLRASNISAKSDINAGSHAWHSCDSHVFVIAPRGEGPFVTGGATWSIFARGFVEFILDEQWTEQMNKEYFYYASTFVQEESFFSSMLRNYDRFKDRRHHHSLFFSKPYASLDMDGLCRRSRETDTCGRGPPVLFDADLPLLQALSHQKFFARKFPTDETKIIRSEIINMINLNNYDVEFAHHTPMILVEHLSVLIKEEIESSYELSGVEVEEVTSITPVVRMIHRNQCCVLAQVHDYYPADEFVYWLELDVRTRDGSRDTARALVASRTSFGHNCFPGHLQLMHLTTDPTRTGKHPGPLPLHPLPFETIGGGPLHLSLFLNRQEKSSDYFSDCPNATVAKARTGVTYAEFEPIEGDEAPRNVLFKVEVEAPEGHIVCAHNLHLHLDDSRAPPDQKDISWFRTNVLCQGRPVALYPGLWTVRMIQQDADSPFIYSQSLFLLDSRDDVRSQLTEAMTRDLFHVEEVMLPTLEVYADYYGDGISTKGGKIAKKVSQKRMDPTRMPKGTNNGLSPSSFAGQLGVVAICFIVLPDVMLSGKRTATGLRLLMWRRRKLYISVFLLIVITALTWPPAR